MSTDDFHYATLSTPAPRQFGQCADCAAGTCAPQRGRRLFTGLLGAGLVLSTQASTPLEDVAAIVRAESLDRDSANNGGMIEIGKESRVLPDVVLAAKNMKTKGEFAVVTTSSGAALLQFVERRPNRKRTFEEVQSLLVNEANIKQRDAHLKGHLDKLQNLPIEAERETVASLRTRYPNGEIPKYGSR